MDHYEIEACVIRAKNGSQEDLVKIMELYKPFIIKTARLFNIKDYDTYDLTQIGYITLIHAVSKYNAGTHTFSSYAYNAIKNSFKLTARHNHKHEENVSLNLIVDNDSDTPTEHIDTLEALENLEEEIILSERDREIRKAVARLSPEDMELVIMIYYSNTSLRTYAAKKRLSYFQAVRRRNRILEKLSRYLYKITR